MSTSERVKRNGGDRDVEDGGTLRMLIWAVLFVAGLAMISRVIGPRRHALEGKVAPDFSLTTLDTGAAVGGGTNGAAGASNAGGSKGAAAPNRIALADLRGKAVLIDFWASWCGPCKAQSPILDGISKRLGDQGLVVVGIATNDSPSAARRWSRDHGISYPIAMDEDGALARQYGANNLPTLVLLGKDGTIKAVRVGLTDASELEGLIRKEL